jgi:hypothetical protein
MLMATDEAGERFVKLRREERLRCDYPLRLRGAAPAAVLEDPEVRATIEAAERQDERAAATLKRSLILFDWVSERPLPELESQYGVGGGVIHRLGEEAAWLVRTLVEMARVLKWPDARVKELSVVADCLALGVKEELLPLRGCAMRGIGRATLRAIHDAGLLTADAVPHAGKEKLAAAIGARRAAKVIEALKSTEPVANAEGAALHLRVESGRAVLASGGSTTNLTEAELTVVLFLTAFLKERDGWVANRHFGSKVEAARKSANRGRAKLAEALRRQPDQVVQNNYRRGYRLTLKPAEVRIDMRGLRAVYPEIVREVEAALGGEKRT